MPQREIRRQLLLALAGWILALSGLFEFVPDAVGV